MRRLTSFDFKTILRSSLIAFSFVVGLELSLRPSLGVQLSLVLISLLSLVFSADTLRRYGRQLIFFLTYIFSTWLVISFLNLIKGNFESFNVAILLTLTYASLTAYLLLYSVVNIWILKIAQYAILSYFAIQCITYGALDPEIFVYSSRSFISTILLGISVPIQFLNYQKNNRVEILPPLLIAYISFFSWSRTGFVCSVLYALIILFFSINRFHGKFTKTAIGIVTVILAAWFIKNNFDLIDQIDVLAKFEEKGMDLAGRDNMWKNYFKDFGLTELFLGGEIASVESGVKNAHNSLIQLHGQLGFIGLCILIFIVKRWIYLLRENFFLFLLLSTLLALCAFNLVFFFTIYDFAIYMFIFSKQSLIERKTNERIKLSIF